MENEIKIKSKEVAIDEEFKYNDKILKCVKQPLGATCLNCYFYKYSNPKNEECIVDGLLCCHEERTDNNDVIFVEMK